MAASVRTWRDSPMAPPVYERKCIDCELWHQCPACPETGWCEFVKDFTGIGEGCEE